jgi:hypothetical protein
MKAASPELIALLASQEFEYVDCFTFELNGGSDENYRLRWTNGQQDITTIPLDGDPTQRVWRAREMLITGLRSRQSIGVKVDEQSVTLTPADDTLIQGVPALEAILWGALDGAFVRRDRFYYDGPAIPSRQPVGGLTKFKGLVSTFTELGRSTASLKVKSALVLLDKLMPAHLTQPTCINAVYDAGCGLIKDDLAVQGYVEAGPTLTFVPWAALSDSGFSLGRVFFENMGLVGTWRAIKNADATGLTLAFPLPRLPIVGEQFVAYPGCNRTHDRCMVINPDVSTRFRGYRFVPQAEKAF